MKFKHSFFFLLTSILTSPIISVLINKNRVNLSTKPSTNNKNQMTTDEEITNKVFMKIEVLGNPIGTLVLGLYGKVVPRTTENFLKLCTGENGLNTITNVNLSYIGSVFFKIIPNSIIQGGDIENNDGTGGESIYGEDFENENYYIKHSIGTISMKSNQNNMTSSQFYFDLNENSDKNGVDVVFGKVISGYEEILKRLESLGSETGEVLGDAIIGECGEIRTNNSQDSSNTHQLFIIPEENVSENDDLQKKEEKQEESQVIIPENRKIYKNRTLIEEKNKDELTKMFISGSSLQQSNYTTINISIVSNESNESHTSNKTDQLNMTQENVTIITDHIQNMPILNLSDAVDNKTENIEKIDVIANNTNNTNDSIEANTSNTTEITNNSTDNSTDNLAKEDNSTHPTNTTNATVQSDIQNQSTTIYYIRKYIEVTDEFTEYYCKDEDRTDDICAEETTESYKFVCGLESFNMSYKYYKTRQLACEHYYIDKVVSDLCPHHAEYFKNSTRHDCKEGEVFNNKTDDLYCGISLKKGLVHAKTIEEACSKGSKSVFSKGCPSY